MTIRILYLHGIENSAHNARVTRWLSEKFPDGQVVAPNLQTRRTSVLFSAGFMFFVLALVSLCCVTGIYWKWWAGVLLFIATAVVSMGIYALAGRGVTHVMQRRAVSIAEKSFKEFRPNLIVASAFGAVVAVSMDIPKLPMVCLMGAAVTVLDLTL
eukprot:GHVQ01023797.1.p1 GENE.GHVQ01023797.1~~GHVQ01023797.1.p1  ORF type:complete len:156 (-),score=9.21 GHVQ01023797.1:49-516(-)